MADTNFSAREQNTGSGNAHLATGGLPVADDNPIPVKVMGGGGGGGGGDVGSTTDSPAPADGTGNYGVISALKRVLLNGAALLSRIPALVAGRIPTVDAAYDPIFGKLVIGNARGKIRDGFDSLDTTNIWEILATGTNDLIVTDGNANGTSYQRIVKSPLNANTETVLLSRKTFKFPVRAALGMSLSQRIAGQEFYFEMVGVDENGNVVADVADAPVNVSSVTTATTVWTFNTTGPHGYVVGDVVQPFGFADSRFNVPLAGNAIVTGIPAPNQFTITAANLSNASAGAGFVLRVRPSGVAREAAGFRWSGTTANNSNPYTRSGASSVYLGPEVAFGTSASVVAAGFNVANTFAHQPSNSFEFIGQMENVNWLGIGMNATTAPVVAKRMESLPDIEREFKICIRARNLPNLTVPVGKIATATKSASNVASLNIPGHGLTNGDQVVVYGVRDQATTSFPNVTAATAVTVVDANNIQVVMGTSGTATSAGGYVARVQGGVVAFGAIAQAIQSISRVNGQIIAVGSAAWAGLAIGETAVFHGMDGSAAVYDGSYRVASLSGTTLVVDAPGPDFGSITCGGGVIKATDFRLHYLRVLDYTRHLTEVVGGLNRRDGNNAVPVVIQPGGDPSPVTQSGTWNVGQILGTAATRWFTQLTDGTNSVAVRSTAATSSDIGLVVSLSPNKDAPIRVADVASAALTSTGPTAAFTPTGGTSYEVNIPVTAVTGTNPTLDVGIEESDDDGANWFRVYDFPRITATGMYRSPKLPLTGNRVRYVQTVGGTSPSFTRAINRLQCYDSAPLLRQLFDWSISLTTNNAVTPSLNVNGCRNVQLAIRIGTATTAPQIQLEGSDDNGLSWYAIGAPVVATASATTQLTVTNIQAALIRGRVSTPGNTVAAGHYVMLKGF